MKNLIKVTSCFLLSFAIFTIEVSASSTDGTIDSVYKYAWSEKLGWINFGLTSGNVHVLDTRLTGYVWNENTGWIILDLSTSTYVANDSEGVLSGYAWGEGIGWIDFNGVTIDSNGYFHGYASSTLGGQISFNCLNMGTCGVSDWKTKTDWVKASLRSQAQVPLAVVIPTGGLWFIKEISKIAIDANKSNTPASNISVKKAESSCVPYLVKYIKPNKKNDKLEVKKIQYFLAKYEGFTNIEQNGEYNAETIKAIHLFQKKYRADILGPWNTKNTTGYIYKTTQKKINELYCSYTKNIMK